MTTDEQIRELNETVKCTLKPSKIHGIGVFAIRDIKEGEKLNCHSEYQEWLSIPYERFNEIREEVRNIILQRWPLVAEGSDFVHPNDDARLISFMNHSDNPNYNPHTDTAIRGIIKDEEITENYETLTK